MQPYQEPFDQDRYPRYTIQAAARLTGLKPSRLRAWERRYGVPSPTRRPNGHRLYAEYDLRLVRWLAAQTVAGLTIGRAVDFLHHLHLRGHDPIALPTVRRLRGGESRQGDQI
jgi:DNA-binding transcriptional MerR regulator